MTVNRAGDVSWNCLQCGVEVGQTKSTKTNVSSFFHLIRLLLLLSFSDLGLMYHRNDLALLRKIRRP